jgi:hypothetical protein
MPAAPRSASQPAGRDLDDDFQLGSGFGSGAGPGGAPSPVDAGGSFDTFGELELDDGRAGGRGAGVAGSAGASPAVDLGGGLDLGGGDFDPDFDELEGSTTEAVASAAAHSAPKRRDWPTGTTAEPDPTALDRRDIDELAGYGDAPESVALAPVYAVQVLLRRRSLGPLLARAEAELGERERARDDLLGKMALELRSELEGTEQTRRLLAAADAAADHVEQAKREVAGANADYAREVESTEASIRDIDARIAEAEGVAGQKRAALDAARTAQQRVEAQEKRRYIELRPIAELADQKGAVPSPKQLARARELEAEIAQLKPQVSAARAATQAAQAEVAAAERAVDARVREQREARRRRRALDLTYGKEIEQQSGELVKREDARREVLAETGREVLGMRGTLAVPDATLDGLLAADRRVNEQALEVQRHRAALAAFDDERYKQGLMMAGGAAAALLLLVVYLIVS